MYTYSVEHKKYLKKIRLNNITIFIFRLLIICFLMTFWEFLSINKIINPFLYSSPSNIFKTIISLFNNDLFLHIGITLYEVLVSFVLSSTLGIIIAFVLWWNKNLFKIIDPYLTIINSLPKVALGPLIIIWIGASTNSIIFMALMISLFTTIINIYNYFVSTDNNYIIMLKSFGASKFQIFKKIILPSNICNIISTLKINISLSLIGVIMGELLVSKKGLGYLIMYGSQVFNLDLVIASIFILGVISFIMYFVVAFIEKKYISKFK